MTCLISMHRESWFRDSSFNDREIEDMDVEDAVGGYLVYQPSSMLWQTGASH